MSKQRQYRGKPIAGGEMVKGWHCVWQGISLIFDSPWNLYHRPVEVIPSSVQFAVGDLWFDIDLFEAMAIQSREYKKGLTNNE